MKLKLFNFIFFAVFIGFLTGCASTTATQTENIAPIAQNYSAPLNFTPDVNTPKSVHVKVNNSLNTLAMDVEEQIKISLREKGYRVVQTADKANYTLEVNVLQVAQNDIAEADENLKQGYNGVIINNQNILKPTKDESELSKFFAGKANYQIIADIQISERDRKPTQNVKAPSSNEKNTNTKKATADTIQPKKGYSDVSAYMNVSHWTRYQTRLLLAVNNTSGDFLKARPVLEDKLTTLLVNLF